MQQHGRVLDHAHCAWSNTIALHRIQEDISEASVIFGVKQVCLFKDDVKFNFERETKFLPGPDRRSDEGQDLLFLLSHDQGASGQHGPPRRNA